MLKLLKGSQKLNVVIAKKNKGNLHNEVPHLLKLETPSHKKIILTSVFNLLKKGENRSSWGWNC